MKMRVAAMLAVATLSLTACGEKQAVERPAVSPAARVVGEPQNCIQRTAFNDTRIRDDWTIDFMRNSTSGWRNTLPNRCSGLRSANAFTFRTSINQICSVDIINVLQMMGSRPTRGAGCGLGRFVPIEIDR
jgi:predicted small lipoprotein YifL